MEDNWAEIDNVQFANMEKFDNLEMASFILLDDTLYLVEDNSFW